MTLSFSPSLAVQPLQKRKNPRRRRVTSTWRPHRNSGSTSWCSTRFIGSTQTSRTSRERTPTCARLVCFCTRSPGIDVYEGSMTQEPNSSHSLAPLGYPSDPKNHRQSPFSLFLSLLLPGACCPHPVLAHPACLPLSLSLCLSLSALHRPSRFLIGRRISFFGNAEGFAVPGTKRRV